MTEDLAQRLARLLETSLQASGISQRQLEERLGWKPGSLSRILEGGTECDPQQLLEILGELGEAERSRPGRARRRGSSTSMVDDLLERSRLLGYGRQTPPPVELPEASELEETVRGALRRAFPGLEEQDVGGEEED